MAPTVVVGGGIVGLCTAYYLAEKGHKVTLIEKCAIACHSSGKAGGYLTDGDSGWHRYPIAPLAKFSFGLHEKLAGIFGAAAIGYRAVRCVGAGRGETPSWLKPSFGGSMGEKGLAQVSPLKLTAKLEEAIKANGCEVLIGKVVDVKMEENAVVSLQVQQQDSAVQTVPCEKLVLAMGAWAKDAAGWFPKSVMPKDTVSHRYTSVIWDNTEVGKDATMVFVSGEHDVEIYPRADECYANGCPSVEPLPDNPLDIEPPPQTVENVKAEATMAVNCLKDAAVIRSTACFLPGSEDGLPVIGQVPKVENAYIGCGGGCWGILNGPAMGHCLASLVLGEKPSVDIDPFDPVRFERRGLGRLFR
mmetsp:Transcript_36919/g.67621  ORF Transcript_36919/g.67621 Transcript_36919/m.67621 type:complete len:359 (-) Transcript_36919:56-1132(-)